MVRDSRVGKERNRTLTSPGATRQSSRSQNWSCRRGKVEVNHLVLLKRCIPASYVLSSGSISGVITRGDLGLRQWMTFCLRKRQVPGGVYGRHLVGRSVSSRMKQRHGEVAFFSLLIRPPHSMRPALARKYHECIGFVAKHSKTVWRLETRTKHRTVEFRPAAVLWRSFHYCADLPAGAAWAVVAVRVLSSP